MSIDAWGVLPRKFLKFNLTLNLALILAENNSLINAIIISWLYNNVKPSSLDGNPDHVKKSSIMAVCGMLRCFFN